MQPLSYITSERFIHDDLVEQAELGLGTLKDVLKKHGRVDPYVLSWPQENLEDKEGKTVNHVVACALPEDTADWAAVLLRVVQRTKPYGLLLVEQKKDEVVALFETQHGARSWHYPLIQKSSSWVLGEPSTTADAECIGILWRTTQHRT